VRMENLVVMADHSDEEEKYQVFVEGPASFDWDEIQTDNYQEAVDEAESIAAELGCNVEYR
jgi:hypothetical protein